MLHQEQPRRRAFLIDVEIRRKRNTGFTDVRVPIPELGIYQIHDGVWQALTATLSIPSDMVKINKTQPFADVTLGTVALDAHANYRVRYKAKHTSSIHEDYHTESKVFTGSQLRIYNEQYGRPAETRYQRKLEAERTKFAPGVQLSLFGPLPEPASAAQAIELADRDFEW